MNSMARLILLGTLILGTQAARAQIFFDDVSIITSNPDLELLDSDSGNSDWSISADCQGIVAGPAEGLCISYRDNSDSSTGIPFIIESDAKDNALYVDADGNIGMGTSTPVSGLGLPPSLTLTGSTAPNIYFDSTGFDPQLWRFGTTVSRSLIIAEGADMIASPILEIAQGAPPGSWLLEEDGDFAWAADAMFLDVANGRLGIGAAAPSDTLHLNNQVGAPGLLFDSNGTDFRIGGNDNLSIALATNPGNPTGSVLTIENELDGTPGGRYPGLGIWESAPQGPLHVGSVDGSSAQVIVENTTGEIQPRTLLELRNAGNTKFELTNTDAGESWAFTNSGIDFRVSLQDSGVVEFRVDNNGNAHLAGVLNENSDVNSKRNIVRVDPQTILRRVMQLQMSEWSYRDSPAERHLGPMAQDFRRVLGLGGSETSIASLDAAGVALAAIQAVAVENQQLRSELEQFRAEIAALKTAGHAAD